MVIGSTQRVASLEGDIALSLFNTELEKVRSVKCLGFNIDGAKLWNELPSSLKDETSLKNFVHKLDDYTISTSEGSYN